MKRLQIRAVHTFFGRHLEPFRRYIRVLPVLLERPHHRDKGKVHVRLLLIHVNPRRYHVFHAVPLFQKVIACLKKLLVFRLRQVFGSRHDPRDHHVHVLAVLTMHLGTPLPHKLALLHLLMGGKVVVQIRPLPVYVLVAYMLCLPVVMCEHVTATRPCMLHHVSHRQPSFTRIFTKEFSTAKLHCQNGVAS